MAENNKINVNLNILVATDQQIEQWVIEDNRGYKGAVIDWLVKKELERRQALKAAEESLTIEEILARR